MDNLVRAISKDGSVLAIALDSTNMVSEIEKAHKTSAVITAALGRLATASGIMGAMLKSPNDSLTLRIKADGPSGTLIAVSDSSGNVKAYVENPIVEIPLNPQGKLDVAGAVGKNGVLSVIKDLGLKEPFTGQIPIISGEIAEDITHYYATSEQVPTVCGLGVLVNSDLSVKSAGGFIIQLLPFADQSCIDVLEQNIKGLPPVSEIFSKGTSPEQLCMQLLNNLEPDILDSQKVHYHCDCSVERVKRALTSLGKTELEQMINEGNNTEVKCDFCKKSYSFRPSELEEMIV